MALQSNFTLFFFAICLLMPLAQSTDVKYCNKDASYAVKVQSVEIHPNPVLSGSPVTFNVSASTAEVISGGILEIQVFFFGLHVHTEKHNICDKVSCPVNPGIFILSATQTLPGFTPWGSYTLNMIMEEREQKMTCITFAFKIGPGISTWAT